MKLLKTVSQGMDENCYIMVNELTNEAMVIDPGAEDYKIKELIDKNELKVKAILLTHCHYDHIESLRAIKDYTGADVYICSGEQVIAESENANLSVYLGGRPLKAEYDIVAEDNDRFEIGGLNFKRLSLLTFKSKALLNVSAEDITSFKFEPISVFPDFIVSLTLFKLSCISRILLYEF